MDKLHLLGSNPIFQDFTSEELAIILQIGEQQSFECNVELISEGDVSDDFFIILKGKAEILKTEETNGKTHHFCIATLSAGDVCGEIAFVDHLPRSTAVKAIEPVEILKISHKNLYQSINGEILRQKLIRNIAKTSVKRLRESNIHYADSLQETLKIAKTMHNFGVFFICVMISMNAVTISEFVIAFLNVDVRSDLSTSIRVILAALPVVFLIWWLQPPLKDFGVTLEGWKPCIVEGTIIGILLTIAALFIDAFLSSTPIKKEFMDVIHTFKGGSWLIIYPILSYIQEFIARGVIQSSIQRFLLDTKGYLAVLITSIIFAGVHIHRGWQFVLLSFIGSILMGLVYIRRPNLIGVTIVHSILGFVLLPVTEKY